MELGHQAPGEEHMTVDSETAHTHRGWSFQTKYLRIVNCLYNRSKSDDQICILRVVS